uniref:Translation initiation factor IF-3 n=1 Tax=Octactis speculum TaxID=3111310 RepID=A0A7S2H9R6_9STRA
MTTDTKPLVAAFFLVICSSVTSYHSTSLTRSFPMRRTVPAKLTMATDRGSRAPPQREKRTMLMNDEIKQSPIRVVLANAAGGDEMLGVMTNTEAMEKANEANLDLVLISPGSDPPVCKIVDYGKLKYQMERKKKDNLKKTKVNEMKEVKMSYKIDTHDYMVRQKAAIKFLKSGSRVKAVVQFRGREQQHINLGQELLKKLSEDCKEFATSDRPRREGNRVVMFINPVKDKTGSQLKK